MNHNFENVLLCKSRSYILSLTVPNQYWSQEDLDMEENPSVRALWNESCYRKLFHCGQNIANISKHTYLVHRLFKSHVVQISILIPENRYMEDNLPIFCHLCSSWKSNDTEITKLKATIIIKSAFVKAMLFQAVANASDYICIVFNICMKYILS